MDYISKFRRQAATYIFFALFIPAFSIVLVSIVFFYVLETDVLVSSIAIMATAFSTSLISYSLLSSTLTRPIEVLSDTITYIGRPNSNTIAPTLDKRLLARELIESLSRVLYDLAETKSLEHTTTSSLQLDSTHLLDGFAIPLIIIDNNQRIIGLNKTAADYVGSQKQALLGKQLYDVFSFSFQTEDTFEAWLNKVKSDSLTAIGRWERVRHTISDENIKQFDMTASYSKDSSTGAETMLALFDKSDQYGHEDQDVSFVALAVHELRTPLTIMRGYIEVFEEEIGPTLSPELTDFMHKMHASAQQLAAFINNILNVARIDENQLVLKLREEEWNTIITKAIDDLQLRAKVNGKTIELSVEDSLPTVAVDRISIHETINNLVDNAIKYGGKSDKIIVKTVLNSDGLVETSIQDFGIGIPSSVMPDLFKKYRRSHKSKSQIGGTGLGLYLSKALVSAHGGNLWVRSKEGEGSIFSFTVIPFDQMKQDQISAEDGIIRGAHGWIKNHSLYRN